MRKMEKGKWKLGTGQGMGAEKAGVRKRRSPCRLDTFTSLSAGSTGAGRAGEKKPLPAGWFDYAHHKRRRYK